MRRFFLILFLLLIVAGAWIGYALYLPAGPTQEKFVLLRPGSSARHIAAELQQQGIIRSRYAFLLLHAWRGGAVLRAGEYRFDHPASAFEVYDRLARGDVYYHVVTIPEGFNMFDVAQALSASGLGSRDEFLRLMRDPTSIRGLDPQAVSLDGYLFPDTYQFTRTQSPREILAAMTHRFRQEAKSIGLLDGSGEPTGPDLHQVVTMASIVEKETAVPDERPLVASVYYNRLQRRMALSADPTVIYAAQLAGRYRGTIYESDLQADSPYNTYKHPGLPPGPVSNPGKASLQAAMTPADSDYLYFVSDGNSHHRFARTIAEHNKNVALYRKAAGGR